jgi:hypothetical protein
MAPPSPPPPPPPPSPGRHTRTHSAPVTTPQMLALDRSDYKDEQVNLNTESRSEALLGSSPRSRSNSTSTWWDGVTETASKMAASLRPDATQQQDSCYTSLDDNNGRIKKLRPLYKHLTIPTSPTAAPPRTKEDTIREDCHFFFREMEDESPPVQSEAVDDITCLPPRSRAAYRARFQQLNSLTVVVDHDDELLLREEEGLVSSPSVPMADFSKSSLYCNIDGRVLMRLPKDKVRLSMDPHLEPGILSVEHCPKGHELTYVLSVDDDLYRRVVSEIADTHSSICGVHQCCTDTGHLNIQVAYCLVVLVLILLLINTIIYPGD